MTFGIFVKFVVIAFLAGLATLVPMFVYFSFAPLAASAAEGLMSVIFIIFAVMFVVILPVAALVFAFAKNHLVANPKTLVPVTILAAIVLLIASLLLIGSNVEAFISFAIIIASAASAFSGLVWLWVIRPLHREQYG